MDLNDFSKTVVDHNIDWVIHNSSLLSASGEQNPLAAIDLNVKGMCLQLTNRRAKLREVRKCLSHHTIGLQNALEVARKYNLRIFAPSSIAAFGPSTPKVCGLLPLLPVSNSNFLVH
jgi:threonine 3-dehydrogenase